MSFSLLLLVCLRLLVCHKSEKVFCFPALLQKGLGSRLKIDQGEYILSIQNSQFWGHLSIPSEMAVQKALGILLPSRRRREWVALSL